MPFSSKKEKVEQDQVPWGVEQERLGVQVGTGWADWAATCLGSSAGPACCGLHPAAAEPVCPVRGQVRRLSRRAVLPVHLLVTMLCRLTSPGRG